MAEKTNVDEIPFLAIFKEFSYVHCSLKFPNFSTLSECDSISLNSSPFEFRDATWCFRICSVKEEKDISKKILTIDVVMLDSKIAQQKLFCVFILLDTNLKLLKIQPTLCSVERNNVENKLTGNHFSMTNENIKPVGSDLILAAYIFLDEPTDIESAHQEPLTTNRDIEMLSKDFEKLFLNGKKHDLTLRVGHEEFRVHQDILMARSQVFKAMLSHDMTEKDKGIIDVPDADPKAMEQLLFYIYSGRVKEMNQDNVLGLYYLADKYSMILLKEDCAKFIKESFSPSLISEIVQLALNHSDADLLHCATEYFGKHISEILPTVEWMSFMKSNPIAANELLIKATKKCDCNKS